CGVLSAANNRLAVLENRIYGVTGTSVQKIAVVISSKSIKRLFNADYRISKIGKHKIFLEHSCRN
ncbi:hypothetical protein DRJ93_16730, partial [Enterococcus faecalis]